MFLGNKWVTLALFSIALAAPGAAHGGTLADRVQTYASRYLLADPSAKLVDNRGNGHEDLYGVRNFRVVLKGVLYRGGANNVYHREHPRDNKNPLQADALENLCEEGFSESIYLYPTNYSPASMNCQSRVTHEQTHFEYEQLSALDVAAQNAFLKKIYQNLQAPDAGPIYAHCWNGWHASGLVSALSLRQFCGWSADQAVAYWNLNTDGVNQGEWYERVRQQIRDFVPRGDMQIPASTQSLICP